MLKTAIMLFLLPVWHWYCFSWNETRYAFFPQNCPVLFPPKTPPCRQKCSSDILSVKKKIEEKAWLGIILTVSSIFSPIPFNNGLLEEITYFVFLCRMFLSLWLFVEFVFLEIKQLWCSHLKVIAIQIPAVIFLYKLYSILTLAQLVHHLWHRKRTGQKENTEVNLWGNKRKIPVLKQH